MNNSAHIFRELKQILPQLAEKYQDKDVFFIGLRLEDGATTKVEAFFEEIEPVLFHIIDTNCRTDLSSDKLHPVWRLPEFKYSNLLSIFICDATAQTIYDSRYYQQKKQKYTLRNDKDIRIPQFKNLPDDTRQEVAELLAAQITEAQVDLQNEAESGNKGDLEEDNLWGEMPWDFKE